MSSERMHGFEHINVLRALPLKRRGAADRPLLIGTPETIRETHRLLRAAGAPIRPLGAVLLHHAPESAQRRPRWAGGPAVLGSADDLERIVRDRRVRTAFLSIPMAMHALAARLAARLDRCGVTVKRLPTMRDLLDGRAAGGGGVAVDPALLLPRAPHRPDRAALAAVLRGRRVMVTGAGGSIGSELALIAGRSGAAELLLMERAENNLFEIDRRLDRECGGVRRRLLLHDVTDAGRTLELTLRLRPDVIFHAAAHKHVPMMEQHPRQALVNNFFGTRAIADAARAAGAERFVMVSTDKAVNPAGVMGATKRAAELYVQHLAACSDTAFTMVRFGNVLGSACSVAPIWARQLAEGGPITVTDPRMRRYLMTIGEAAALVIQAASLERGSGSIFVLDMGEPIRVLDLAERFCRLHGLEPGRDVAIVFTGARPGEKLHEQLAYDGEDVRATGHKSVRLLRTDPPTAHRVHRMVRTFESLRACVDERSIVAALREAVCPTHAASTAGPAAGAAGADVTNPRTAHDGSNSEAAAPERAA